MSNLPSKFFAAALAAGVSLSAFAGDVEEVAARLKDLYPATTFGRITAAAELPGLYEVTVGNNMVYTNKEGRYFLFGHIYDMKERVDVTAERSDKAAVAPAPNTSATAAAAGKMPLAAFPIDDAIKTVRGDGHRRIAVFSDPNCPYCKRFEHELAKLQDVTIYTYLLPILSEDSRRKAAAVWCASDRTQAWDGLMAQGQLPSSGDCDVAALDRNRALARRLGINGTPTFVIEDGTLTGGMRPAAVLEDTLGK